MAHITLTRLIPALLSLPLLTASSSIFTRGCSKNRNLGCPDSHHILTSSNRTRSFHLDYPFPYISTTAYPLVLGFHDRNSTGRYFYVDTNLHPDEYNQKAIMVFLDVVGGT